MVSFDTKRLPRKSLLLAGLGIGLWWSLRDDLGGCLPYLCAMARSESDVILLLCEQTFTFFGVYLYTPTPFPHVFEVTHLDRYEPQCDCWTIEFRSEL